jgi:hypothetical protein
MNVVTILGINIILRKLIRREDEENKKTHID